jgi:hypothetical protein
MKKSGNKTEDDLQPHYDLDKLEVVAYGPGWKRPRRLRKKGQRQAVDPKLLAAVHNPARVRAAQVKR